MSTTLDAYLQELKQALHGCDPAVVQDALGEARTRLKTTLAHLSWKAPELSPSEAWVQAISEVGSPEAFVQSFLSRDRLVAEALGRQEPSPDPEPIPPRAWPSFLGIFAEGRTYTTLLYLFLTLVTGIFYFTWVVTGLSLSLGLLVLIIGFPLLALFLGSVRALGLAEGRLVEALLGERMPRRPALMPEGRTWLQRLGNLFSDTYTWKALLYLLLMFPLGIFYFTFLLTTFCVAFSILISPILIAVFGPYIWQVHSADGAIWSIGDLPVWAQLGGSAIAGVCIVGLMHLLLAFGRFHGWLAKQLLVQR